MSALENAIRAWLAANPEETEKPFRLPSSILSDLGIIETSSVRSETRRVLKGLGFVKKQVWVSGFRRGSGGHPERMWVRA